VPSGQCWRPPDVEQDLWGIPFRLPGVPVAPYPLSCGPDTSCGTEDDLKVFIKAFHPGEKDLDLSGLMKTNLLDKLEVGGKAAPKQGE